MQRGTDTLDLHLVRLADGLCDATRVPPFATGELGALALESADALDAGPERLELALLQFRELAEQLQALV